MTPRRLRRSDAEVLKLGAANGARFERPREVNLYFYGDDVAALSNALRRLGYAVRPTVAKPGAVATMYRAVDEAWLESVIPEMIAVAEQHAAEFDGWEMSLPERGH